jgi:hypothetical protein
VADVLKKINQPLNENRPEHYATPRDRRLLTQVSMIAEVIRDDVEEGSLRPVDEDGYRRSGKSG